MRENGLPSCSFFCRFEGVLELIAIQASTAILIFANSGRKDSRKKGIPGAESLFDALTRQTVRTAQSTGLPIFLITDNLQEGNTFADRFTHAVAGIFSKGFEAVIALGNDTPSLNSGLLRETITAMGRGEQILGPSKDGGCYLLGLQASAFDPLAFRNLSWQTRALFASLKKFMERGEGPVRLLKPLSDLDSRDDIPGILMELGRKRPVLRTLLNSLRAMPSPLPTHPVQPIAAGRQSIPLNKGSPFFAPH